MQSISFRPEEADLGAAFRLHYRHSLTRWRVMRAFLIMGLGGSILAAALIAGDGGMAWLWAGMSGFLAAALFLALLLFSNYLHVSRRARRTFTQQKTLHSETRMEWNDAGISVRSERGFSDLRWDDFFAFAADEDVIILLQSESLMNFIPMRVLSAEQAGEIMALLKGAGVKGRA